MVIDRDARMSFAYVMNRVAPEIMGNVRGASIAIGDCAALASR